MLDILASPKHSTDLDDKADLLRKLEEARQLDALTSQAGKKTGEPAPFHEVFADAIFGKEEPKVDFEAEKEKEKERLRLKKEEEAKRLEQERIAIAKLQIAREAEEKIAQEEVEREEKKKKKEEETERLRQEDIKRAEERAMAFRMEEERYKKVREEEEKKRQQVLEEEELKKKKRQEAEEARLRKSQEDKEEWKAKLATGSTSTPTPSASEPLDSSLFGLAASPVFGSPVIGGSPHTSTLMHDPIFGPVLGSPRSSTTNVTSLLFGPESEEAKREEGLGSYLP